jgi:hypothetical protein
MRILQVLCISGILFFQGTAFACSILNQEKVQIGSRKGIKGICSNNKLPITCIYLEGTGIQCDGPSGGYTGYDLDNLIFSACGCSLEEEKERLMKKELLH